MDGERRQKLLRGLETAVIGGAGATLFVALHIPAGAVSGAMIFTAFASLAGRRLEWPTPVRSILFMLMGFSAGATLTPASIHAALLWPVSIAVLALATAVMWAAGWVVFRKLGRTDGRTAFYASAPGALSAVMILADQQKADVPKVAVAQSLRLLILVCLSPFALAAGHPAPPPPWVEPIVGGVAGWVIVVGAVLVGWRTGVRFRWPAAAFLGALAGSASVHAFGLVHVRIAPWIVLTGSAALGAMIGARFNGIRFRDLFTYMPASLALVGVMAAIGVPVGVLVGHAVGVGAAPGLMAFAPGSMEMMIAISLALNAYPAYVAAHHLTRTLLLLAVVPALSAHWARRARAQAS